MFSFQVKGSCALEFTRYAMCLEKAPSGKLGLTHCRNTQAAFDGCMAEKLGIERPHYGYHCLTKVHHTDRQVWHSG